MTGSKFYESKRRVILFLALYGGLALLGLAAVVRAVSGGLALSGSAGFMSVFGAGMLVRTFLRSRHPLVALHGDRIELRQTNTAEQVRYKDIIGVEHPDAKRIVLKVRDAHAARKTVIWLRYLEKADAERLAGYLLNRGWKH